MKYLAALLIIYSGVGGAIEISNPFTIEAYDAEIKCFPSTDSSLICQVGPGTFRQCVHYPQFAFFECDFQELLHHA